MAKKVSFEDVQKKIGTSLSKIKTALKGIPYIFQKGQGFSVIDELQSSEMFEYFLLKDEIQEHVVFNRFEVFITKRAAVYHAFNGFWFSVTPFSKGIDGHAHDTTLYQWLENLVATKKASKGKEQEYFTDDREYTYQDLLDADELVTWANMMYPTTVFSDVDKAYEEANKHINWLLDKTKELEEAEKAELPFPDLKADVEAEANAEAKALAIDTIPEE